eukprot:jgi/Mesen1/10934/ME000095S10271
MLVAALLDLGVPAEYLQEALQGLRLDGFWCEVFSSERSAIIAPRFVVHEIGSQPLRDYAVIAEMLQYADMPAGAKALASAAFRLLAEGEASVHGVAIEAVHFHEVGAVDSIVDIVTAALALDYIGASEVCVSALPMGRGIIYGAAHGPLPCPAPATVEILCRSKLPTYDAQCKGELVTPTGACLAGAAAAYSTAWPAMRPVACAYGAGTKVRADRPNLLRLVLGEPTVSSPSSPSK